jgi:hypothetical protein
MPTNSNVRKEVLEKLKISKQALSQRAGRIKKGYGPMTTEEAVYVIAHIQGIDLSKFLPIATLDRIRSLVPKEIQPKKQLVHSPQSIKQKKISYPLISNSLINMAYNLGSEVYPKLFVLENSIRTIITKRLELLDVNWWDTYVPKEIKDNVSRTMKKEKRYPYRETRGSHPISFANFSDLSAIILANQPVFKNIILDYQWFKVKMDEIYMVRNNLAHCVALSNDDITRINLFFRDWSRLLETAGFR